MIRLSSFSEESTGYHSIVVSWLCLLAVAWFTPLMVLSFLAVLGW